VRDVEEVFRLFYSLLAALDDLRTPKWVDLVEYPGLTLQNILEFTH